MVALLTVGGGQLAAQALTAVALLALGHDDVATLGAVAAYYGVAVAAANLVDAGASTRVLRDSARPAGGTSAAAARAVGVVKPGAVLLLAPVVGLLSGDAALGLALAYAGLRGVGLLAQSLWYAGGRPLRAAGTVVAERAVAVACALAAAAAGVSGAVALCGGLVVGGAVTALVAAPTVRAASAGAVGVRWARVAGHGRRFLGSAVAGNLVLLDTVLVAAVAGPVQAGLYAVGARLLGPMALLLGAAGTATLPGLARGERSALRALHGVAWASVALLAAFFATADVLVPLLAGPAFAGAVPAVRCYTAVTVLVVLAQTLVVRLQARGREVLVSTVLAVAVPAGLGAVAAGAALAPGHAAVAAGVGYALVSGLTAAALHVALRPQRDERQREGHGEVPAGRVAQRGEQDVPDRDQQQVRLGQRAGAHRAGQRPGDQPERQ